MLNNAILDQFQFPPDAIDGLMQANLQQVSVGSGASRFMSGHDKGVAYRFFTKPVYNETKSKLCGYEKFDEIEMIEWLTDKYNHPTEQVRFLPEELLHTDTLTGEVRGRYSESYKRYKEGKAAPGTPLEKWGVFSDGEVATLAMNGIFSVEQFAALSKDRIASKFPTNFVDAHERAIQFTNGKSNKVEADKQAAQMLELERKNAKLEAELEAIKAAITAQGSRRDAEDKEEKRRPGRPRKVIDQNDDSDIKVNIED